MKYTLSELASQIDCDKPNVIYLYAVTPAARVVGYLMLEVDEAAGYISACFIEPEHRRNGLGTTMLERAVELCRERAFATVGLSVNQENTAARDLYLRLGFLPYVKGNSGYQQFIKVL